MAEQLDLIPGVRVPPPACYDAVAEAIETALYNGATTILGWDNDDLALDLLSCAGLPKEATFEDIARAIRIWRERHA